MSNFWKIECPHCGSNTDLLMDKYHRKICRECLNKNEFNEVENELRSDCDEKMDGLSGKKSSQEIHRELVAINLVLDSGLSQPNEVPGDE